MNARTLVFALVVSFAAAHTNTYALDLGGLGRSLGSGSERKFPGESRRWRNWARAMERFA